MRYIDLIHAIKNAPNGMLFHNISDETSDKLNRFVRAGCIDLTMGYDKNLRSGLKATLAPKATQIEVKAPMRVYIGDKARLRHPNGIAQLQHDVIGFNGDYVILEHPTLKHRLNRKVEWDSNVEGWVAA